MVKMSSEITTHIHTWGKINILRTCWGQTCLLTGSAHHAQVGVCMHSEHVCLTIQGFWLTSFSGNWPYVDDIHNIETTMKNIILGYTRAMSLLHRLHHLNSILRSCNTTKKYELAFLQSNSTEIKVQEKMHLKNSMVQWQWKKEDRKGKLIRDAYCVDYSISWEYYYISLHHLLHLSSLPL